MTADKKDTAKKPGKAKGWKINKDASENGKVLEKPSQDTPIVKSPEEAPQSPEVEPVQTPESTPEDGAPAPEAETDPRAHAREGSGIKIPDETIDLILAFIADGLSLVQACSMPDMPRRTSFMRRLAADKDLQVRYALACEARADIIADEMIDIADDTSRDTVLTDAGPRANSEWISRSKVRVDTRKWLLSKLAPKKYGDKIDVDHGVQTGSPLFDLIAKLGASAVPLAPAALSPEED